MARKPTNHLNGLEKLLFGIAVIFLCATILRTIQFEPFLKAQTAVQTLLTGQQSIEQAVEAIGSLTDTERIQTVFSDWFPAMQQDEPVMESVPPLETLAATAAGVFPTEAETAVYPIRLAHRSPVADAILTSSFGVRIHPVSGQTNFHKGIDLAADQGQPIYALSDSTVLVSAMSSSYGNYLILQHDDGVCSLYAHCHERFVSAGTRVSAGTCIASVGATGVATGNHLHLELWRAGKLLNPEDYIAI